MLLKDEDIKEFQKLYEEEFGELISDQEASSLASRLITLYEALARPLPSERAQFTESDEDGKLDLGDANKAYRPPSAASSEKVVL